MSVSAASALDRVESLELTRSRRFGRELSILVFQTNGVGDHRRAERARRTSRLTAVAGLMAQQVRAYDELIVDAPNGRIVVVAPETGSAAAGIMQQRLKEVLRPVHPTAMLGAASFPVDGGLLAPLLDRAMKRLVPIATNAADEPSTGMARR